MIILVDSIIVKKFKNIITFIIIIIFIDIQWWLWDKLSLFY